MVHARPQAVSSEPAAIVQQALKHYEAGQLAQARQLCQQVLQQDGRNADAWHLLGMVARADGRLDVALDCLQKAMAIHPHLELRNNYANVLRESGRLQEACTQYSQAVKESPDSAILHSNLGSVYNQLRRFDDAKRHFTRAVELKPDYADAWYNLAVIHNTVDEGEARDAALQKALSGQMHALAAHLMVQSRKSHEDALLQQMKAVYEVRETTTEDKIQLAFGLGKAMDDRKEHAAAYQWFAAANRLKRWSYSFDIHGTESQFEWVKKLFTAEWVERQRKTAYSEKAPLFIVGMPRSGTSLLEQMLAQHKQVHGGGELFYMRDLLAEQERASGRPYPLCTGSVPPDALPQLAARYAEQLFSLAPGKERYVTDKLPGNFCHAGLIAGIFRDAKILYIERDPMDTGLSIFKTFFGDNLPYAYDQWEIGRVTAMCRDLMAHFEKILAKNIFLKVSYETLVAQPEAELRRILDFLGLEWEPACLEFHASARPVTTASVMQVRQPIYKSAIKAADAYGDFLKPMRVAVGAL